MLWFVVDSSNQCSRRLDPPQVELSLEPHQTKDGGKGSGLAATTCELNEAGCLDAATAVQPEGFLR
jgi:hypothetical protein